MVNFLKSTSWQMEKIPAYGAFHILYFVIGVIICLFLGYKLRNVSEKTHKRIIFGVGLFLLITEVYKQLFYTYVIGGGNYQWWIFPFQLCSVPMYLCLIAPWIKNVKIQKYIYLFLISFNLMGGFISFIEPSGLIHEYITLTIHAFLWHMLLVFLGFYLAFSKRVEKNIKDFKYIVLIFIILCVFAFVINLIFWKVSSGDINMFYIGPKNSPIAVFKDIAVRYGWYVNTPIYMFALTLGAYLFYLPICKLYNKFKKA